jgi:hypothetical protein
MSAAGKRRTAQHHDQGDTAMTHPLLQTPMLIFALMMGSFLLVLGPIALADVLRRPRD